MIECSQKTPYYNRCKNPEGEKTGAGMLNRKQLGDFGEKVAAKFLKEHKYKIREMNFRCPLGEIDIVAEKEKCLVFVEVRTRTDSEFGTPEESLTAAKKKKLISLALTYLQSYEDIPPLWRIDVVAVEVEKDGKVSRIDLIENAIHCMDQDSGT
jgi:putative endonuclease